MYELKYDVYMDDECIAREVPLDYAIVFEKALFDSYSAEALEIGLRVTLVARRVEA